MAQYPGAAATDANLYIGVNNKTTNLTSGIDAVVTTIPVASTTGFPAVGFVTIDLEIIAYTSIDATNFLGATRAADGSVATSHSLGALVSHNIVAAHHNAPKDEIIAVEGDLVAIQSSLADSAPGDTASTLLIRIRQIITQIKAIAGTTNWYDAIAVSLVNKLSLTGGTLTGALTINPATNQLVLGGVSGGNTTTVTAPAPAANRTVTVPDGGANSSVVLTESSQTINGAKTFTDPITQNDTSNQIVLGVTNTTTINATTPAASRVVTIPDPGAAASFVMTEGVQTINGNKTFGGIVDVDGQLIGKGTATNDNAAAGDIGQYLSAADAGGQNSPASNVYGDANSLSLTAGDWDVSAVVHWNRAGSTWTQITAGISQTAGDSATGLNQGDNYVLFSAPADDASLSIPSYRQSVASTTTIYLKVKSTFSAGTPAYFYRISARRVR